MKSFDLELKKGSYYSKIFTIRNGGGGILEIHSIKSETDKKKGWLKISKSSCSLSVAHGCKEDVEFSIETKGLPYGYEDKGTITIASNGGNGSIDVNLSIKKRTFPVPIIVVLAILAIAGIVFGVLQTVDRTAPAGSISINNGDSCTNSRTIMLTISATDNVGIIGYHISERSVPPEISANIWTLVPPEKIFIKKDSYIIADTNDGTKTVYVWYKDSAGNISSLTSDSIILDTTSPAVTINNPTSDATFTTTSEMLEIGGSVSDSLSSVSKVWWSNSKGKSWEVHGTESWSAKIKLIPGKNLITVTARDGAGNTGTGTVTINFDIKPAGSISINQGASYSRSKEVTLCLSATDDAGITGYYISPSSSAPSITANGWSSIMKPTTKFSDNVLFALSPSDGNKTVYVWYKDASGNISQTASDSIILDTTAPSITITSPTSTHKNTATNEIITISGIASDSDGVRKVWWSNNGSASKYAVGTTHWSANVKLLQGNNRITVVAADSAGNTRTDATTVVYNVSNIGSFSVINHLMTDITREEFINAYNGCATPPPKYTFFDTDRHATQWFSYQNATFGDTITWKWYLPDGLCLEDKRTIDINEGCWQSCLNIAGNNPGQWQVKVYRNGQFLFAETFTTEHRSSVSSQDISVFGEWKEYWGTLGQTDKYRVTRVKGVVNVEELNRNEKINDIRLDQNLLTFTQHGGKYVFKYSLRLQQDGKWMIGKGWCNGTYHDVRWERIR